MTPRAIRQWIDENAVRYRGQWLVRRALVMPAAGKRTEQTAEVEKRLAIPAVRIPCRIGSRGRNVNPHGFFVFWPVADAERVLRHYLLQRSNRAWTDAEIRTIYRHAYREPLAATGARIGRSACAVRQELIRRYGYTPSLMLQRDRLVQRAWIARVLCVSPGTVSKWQRMGMPAHEYPHTGRRWWYRLDEVRDWLRGREQTLLRIEPRVLDRLGIDLSEAA